LGGPDALPPLQVVELAEQITGKQFAVEHVSEEALRAQYEAATDPMQKSFAGLMLFCAAGSDIDMTEPLKILPVGSLRSVREYLGGTASAAGGAH